MRILYVEDNPTACEYVRKGLGERGFHVDVAMTGPKGFERAHSEPYDLLVLDVMLPGYDGFELLRRLRAQGIDTPVIFLSARLEPRDRITGLNLGADDYLTKPFAFAELVARVRAIARRSTGEGQAVRLVVGDLALDAKRHRVTRGDREIKLTPREFEILRYMMRSPGQVVSRNMILEAVWGYGFECYSNLINVHINHLRKKVDGDRPDKLIHTVRGVGFIMELRARSDAADAELLCAG
jgi:two-component system copper resistance phosphate regulon response regulator CusR